MSTTSDHIDDAGLGEHGGADHGAEGHDYVEHHSDFFYVKIALALAVLTGLEVTLTYIDIGALFLPLLLILMIVKFFMVVLFFMHLKFDSKWFSFFFYTGLGLAVGCYLAFLATFRFFMSN
jgi:cytochrome c oxidase subunit 4